MSHCPACWLIMSQLGVGAKMRFTVVVSGTPSPPSVDQFRYPPPTLKIVTLRTVSDNLDLGCDRCG